MRKKVIFLAQNFAGGGAERVLLNILNNLDYNKFEIELLLLENTGIYLEKIKNNKNLKIINFKNKFNSRYINFIFNFFRALNYLRKKEGNIVFSQMNTGKLLGFFKFLLRNKKVIYRETLVPKGTLNELPILVSSMHRLFYKFFIQNQDIIIAQSEDMKNKLIEINRKLKEKIVVINNPVDIELIEKESNERIEDIQFEKIINLISVGRLSRQKGYDLLIETLSKIKNKNVKLYLLGIGEEENNLKNLVKKYKLEQQILFLGFKTNPYKYIKNSDFFISSSRVEGFPNAVLEACACGVPVIANNYLGGINEIIIPELNGEIIDITDEIAFENALNKKYISSKIKKLMKERYDKEIIIKRYEKLFKNIK